MAPLSGTRAHFFPPFKSNSSGKLKIRQAEAEADKVDFRSIDSILIPILPTPWLNMYEI